MERLEINGPSAATTGTGTKSVAHLQDKATEGAYHAASLPHNRFATTAIGPKGPFTVIGQIAKALSALVTAGGRGVTALEANSWAFRLAAYVHTLRRDCGLEIETIREPHDGGWHARYVLRSPVSIEEGVA